MICALIGHGYWGHILEKKLRDSPDFDLGYICDLKGFSEQEHIQYETHAILLTQDYNSIIKNPNIEAIFIATPPNTHFELAYQALADHKHVWLEKPCCTSLDEITTLQKLALSKDKTLHLGLITLFSIQLQQMKEKASTLFHTQSKQSLRFIRENYQHQGASAVSPFDILYDLGVHDLASLHYLFPHLPPHSFSIQLEHIQGEYSQYKLELNHESISVEILLSWTAPQKRRCFQWKQGHITLALEQFGVDETLSIYEDNVSTSTTTSLKEPDSLERALYSFSRDISQKISNKKLWSSSTFFHKIMKYL